jgi:hypothetical protein
MPENRRTTGEAMRWNRGQSGNPGGRPKMALLSQACGELLATQVPDNPEGHAYAHW